MQSRTRSRWKPSFLESADEPRGRGRAGPLTTSMLVRRVIKRTPRGERGMDLFSSLLAENMVCFSGPIDDESANLIVAQILYLQSEDPDKDISLYINSPGGSVTAALAI